MAARPRLVRRAFLAGAALLLWSAPAHAVTWNLMLTGGAGLFSNLPGSWNGEAYAGSLSPTATGTTLSSSGSAGASGGYSIEVGLGIPLTPELTFEIWAFYEALISSYDATSLRFTPQSQDSLPGPMSIGLIGLPLQLRYQLPGGFTVFAGAGPAATVLALLVSPPSPETDFESRSFDALIRLGADYEVARWGKKRTSGLALGLLLDGDTEGYSKALFVTVRLFSGSEDPS
ncbi:MAG: hypothetical protein ACYCWW_05700, partial [Deltaproteobacteria bacterium]